MAHMAGDVSQDAPEGVIARFAVLKSAPRELWLIYLAKISETTAYALVNASLMLYLINELGYSDEGAGGFVGVWATVISAFVFLVGSLSDAIGIRKTLIFSFTLCVVTRVLAAVIGHPVLTPIVALMPMALGVAMTIPVMVAGARRYTSPRQRSIGFALLYVVMNVGFLIAGWLYDRIRYWMGEYGTFEIPVVGLELSVYETIFLISAVFTLVGLIPMLLLLRTGVEATDEGTVIDPAGEGEIDTDAGIVSYVGRAMAKTVGILAEVFKEKAFYRFLLLVALVVGVRMVFYHMHYTLPVWADREMGYGSRFGTAWGVINPAFIIVLTPIVGALAQKVSSYKMIIVGTSICALTTFLLVLPLDTFAGLADTFVGDLLRWVLSVDGDLSPLYINLVLFAMAFSVGEAIWSPRLYEYTAAVAPKGREATYMSLSLLPMFVAKLTVGPLAGVLLDAYCPMEGARSSWILWSVVAGMAVFSPLTMILLKKVITGGTPAAEDAEVPA